MIQVLSPLPNSMTLLPGNQFNQITVASMTFSAQGGISGGYTRVRCTPLLGSVTILDSNQAVFTGNNVFPMDVQMTITQQENLAIMRCVIDRSGEPLSTLDFSFKTREAVLFSNGFEG